MESSVCGTRLSCMPEPWRSAWLNGVTVSPAVELMLKAGTIFLIWRTAKVTSLPLSPPIRSPMAVITTCLRPVRSITCSSVWAKFSRMMMTLAPESRNWCSSSRGV